MQFSIYTFVNSCFSFLSLSFSYHMALLLLETEICEDFMLVLSTVFVNSTMKIASDYHRSRTDINIANGDVN